MVDPVLAHVGNRIRLYRKSNKMTMDELAAKVHKTKASISKYESGQTSMDLLTLFEIATALHVSPNHLIDYKHPPTKQEKSPYNGFAFEQYDRLYLYHKTRNTVHFSILELENQQGRTQNVTLFYKIDKSEKLENCECIYHGRMQRHEIVLNFVFRNYHNPVENILLNFLIPIRNASVLTGMISGLGADTMKPTSHKILLSCNRLDTASDELRRMLMIDPKTFKEMKSSNMLFVPI